MRFFPTAFFTLASVLLSTRALAVEIGPRVGGVFLEQTFPIYGVEAAVPIGPHGSSAYAVFGSKENESESYGCGRIDGTDYCTGHSDGLESLFEIGGSVEFALGSHIGIAPGISYRAHTVESEFEATQGGVSVANFEHEIEAKALVATVGLGSSFTLSSRMRLHAEWLGLTYPLFGTAKTLGTSARGNTIPFVTEEYERREIDVEEAEDRLRRELGVRFVNVALLFEL